MRELVCQRCGRLFTQRTGRPAKRCPACRPAHQAKYGNSHQKLRSATLADAYGRPCARCGEPMWPAHDLDLDHDEAGGYRGYSHASCNRAAGAEKRNAKANGRPYGRPRRPRGPGWEHATWDEMSGRWVAHSRRW